LAPPLDLATTAAPGAAPPPADWRRVLTEAIAKLLRERLASSPGEAPTRRRIARLASEALDQALAQGGIRLPLAEQRQLVEQLTAELEAVTAKPGAAPIVESSLPGSGRAADDPRVRLMERSETSRARILPLLMERMDVAVAARLSPAELEAQVSAMVGEIQSELRLQLNGAEQAQVVRLLVDDMLGLGPLEPLLADETVTDIMVNGPKVVYVERRGKLERTEVVFRDNAHVMHVATRIVTRIGRRVDESSPLVDARLPDGSRVNIIIPPLAIDGPSISIRKFAKRQITLDTMVRQGNITEALSTVLKIASRARLNILISGGTGSGKTTLLNAMSRLIDHGERIVTIEDAAELQLQQPHVVRLETRPPSIEGQGEINIRDLVKNALRMRPDRIICGEVRGAEAIDMLQAMNTGHDGSMCTLHANTPREALTRLENMVAMSSMRLPSSAVRMQIASAVHLIVQISRMRDGVRRVAQVSEVIGMEGEIITLQDLFVYQYQGERPDGSLIGRHVCTGFRPHFVNRAEYYGLRDQLLEAMECKPT